MRFYVRALGRKLMENNGNTWSVRPSFANEVIPLDFAGQGQIALQELDFEFRKIRLVSV